MLARLTKPGRSPLMAGGDLSGKTGGLRDVRGNCDVCQTNQHDHDHCDWGNLHDRLEDCITTITAICGENLVCFHCGSLRDAVLVWQPGVSFRWKTMPYEIDFLGAYDTESLIAELKRISSVTGKPTVTSRDIGRVGRVCYETILNRFGSMRAANEAAGLVPNAFRCWSDEELLDAALSLWDTTLREEGRRPLRADAKKYGMPVNSDTLVKRFGTWNKALLAANELAERRWKTRPPKAPGERTTLSVRTRYQVFKRDLYRCRICAKTGVELEVDHIVPIARGGSDEMENLQTLCVPCNRGKRDSLQ